MIEKPNKQSNEESMKKSSEKSNKKSLEKIYKALERFGATDTREFFQQLGLYTKEKTAAAYILYRNRLRRYWMCCAAPVRILELR